MLNFNKVEMRYEPYPLAVLRPALDQAQYNELVENFPDESLFGVLPKYPYKLSLSEKWNPSGYRRFLKENRPWNRFHSWVKSDDFIAQTVSFLRDNHVELPLDRYLEKGNQWVLNATRALGKGRLPGFGARLSSRFEFSSLRADGGRVEPHTDAPQKVITLVLTMIKHDEWNLSYGGGLDVNRAVDNRFAYNWKNKIVPWDKIEVVETIPFLPNQCTVFVKTHNSLHSVREMKQAGSKALRKSVTIVIEREDV